MYEKTLSEPPLQRSTAIFYHHLCYKALDVQFLKGAKVVCSECRQIINKDSGGLVFSFF